MSAKSKTKKSYEKLRGKVRKIRSLRESEGVLRWDQQVMMPDGGTFPRSRQLSTLSSIYHDLLTDEEIGKLLKDIDYDELSKSEKAVVREIKREYERAIKVPTSLVSEISKTSSEAFSKWQKAKEEDDFEIFEPLLDKLVDLKKKYAREIDPDSPPYQVLFEDYEPYISLDTTEKVLTELRKNIIPLLRKIREVSLDVDDDLFSEDFPRENQRRFVRNLLDDLGFCWDRGRLDTAPHPFTTGTQYDVRIATRFHENFLDGLFSTIHEFGHSLYTLGLPREEEKYGIPLAESREMTIHESQSRLWENHIGRSRPFWKYLLPKVKEEFSNFNASLEEVYKAANRVEEDNLIRVEADELTYHLHIALRFEIEKDLVGDNIDVGDVPEVWNEKMEQYLDVRPDSDSRGCLQDVHWSNGYFGYFPTYSLGSVLSAQIYDTLEEELEGIGEEIENGNFSEVRNWLKDRIHSHGKLYRTDELIRKSTDEDLNPDHFLDYIESKYNKVYGIN